MRLRPEFALALVLAACAHPPPASPSPAASPSTGPTGVPLHLISSGNGGFTTLSEMKRGRTLYVVRAVSFEADSSAGHAEAGNGSFERPHITFVDRTGAKTVADAPKAVLTSADKSVLMTGGVHARSQDGNVLSCDRLRYDGDSERIHGEGNVVMTTPAGLTLVGDEIDGDARLANVRVYKK